jgi:hypothetical protein
MEVRKILSGLPAAFDHWKTVDQWHLGEEYLQAKIPAALSLFGIGYPESRRFGVFACRSDAD